MAKPLPETLFVIRLDVHNVSFVDRVKEYRIRSSQFIADEETPPIVASLTSRMRFSAAGALLHNDSEGNKRYQYQYRSRQSAATHSRRNSVQLTNRHQSEGSYNTVTAGQDDEPARTWQREAPPDLAQHKHPLPLRDITNTSKRNRNMPPLRDDGKTNPRPLMPTLATKRNVKSPITPRLAAQHAGNGTSTPPLAKAAPSPRSTLRSPTSNREELATPAKAFISSNVTPRSGSRKSRVDNSNQTTPSGTPNGSRPASHVDVGSIGSGVKQNTFFAGYGLGIAGPGNRSRPSSMVGGVTSPGLGITSQPKFSRPDEGGDGAMFFHANDAQRSPELRPTPVARKSPVFLYANGQQDETARPTSQPSPPLSTVSTKSKKSQFFRADGRADEDIPPVPLLPSPSAHAPPQFFQAAPAFRPPSPGKEINNFHLSYRKGASQIIRPPAERPKTISILPPDALEARKRSVGGISGQSALPHKRTSSLSSIESGASARKTSSGFEHTGLTPLQTILQAHSPASSEPSSAIGSASPIPNFDNEIMAESTTSLPPRERQASPSSPVLSIPQSPTKAQNSFQTQLAETIMNARVERKIQDLEISNSSLMAINKSLEKEVRRQNKELRRFRRLSRAGRLSTVSTARSVGTEDEFGGLGGGLSALDELTEEEVTDEEEEEDEPSSSSDDSSSLDDMSLSPDAIAEREVRKLAKDSKRLQLDLAKHRDILVDSQKVNQSLKRCMAWTDMMIQDGRKALEYKAETEDVRGRVLDHDENGDGEGEEEDGEDEEDGPRHSLLSAWAPSPAPMAALEALDGLLGVDTSAITNGAGTQASAMPAALDKGDFWSIAGALP